MKRFVALAGLLIALVGAVAAWWLGLFSVPSQLGAPVLPDGDRLRQDLTAQGWLFQPVEVEEGSLSAVQSQPINRFQAIVWARQELGSFDWRRGLTGTTANLGYLQSKPDSAGSPNSSFMQPRLVWIVTFAGLEMESSGPPGSLHSRSNEWDVVLDAYSGDYLVGFNWAR